MTAGPGPPPGEAAADPVQAGAAPDDVLRGPDAGVRVVRGGAIRAVGYGAGALLTAVASVFLLRYLGVADFGRYVTVMAIVAIVGGVTDAGLTTVGNRELAIRDSKAERLRLLGNLLGIRLVVTPLGVTGAVAFALAAGYERDLVAGVLISGIGLVMVSAQATMMLPLGVELRNGRITAAELIKQTVTVVGIITLVVAGAGLVPFFAVQVVVGVVILALTPLVVGRRSMVTPRFERATWRMLIVEALPVAVSLALNIIYFRVVIVIASLQASALETGLVGTSFRIFEIVLAIPTLVLGVALPVMSAAGNEDEARLRYILQRMAEAALIASLWIAILIAFTAEPVIVALGGEEYREAAPVLRLQAFSLVSVSLGLVWQGGLISIRRQYAMAVGNGVALVSVVALALWLIPALGPEGAAVAVLIAEALLALTVLLLLIRARPQLTPSFRFVPKVALAAAAAAVPAFVPGLPDVVAAAVAATLYALVVYATGAVPSEVKDSFRLRPRRPSA